MSPNRCELCGEPTVHTSILPGCRSFWDVCHENGCIVRMRGLIGARQAKDGSWELQLDPTRYGGFWTPPSEWWQQLHPKDGNCARIDREAETLRAIWRPHGSAVLHGRHDLGVKDENYKIISHPTVDKGCAVCGHPNAMPHTFIAANGRTMVDLCCIERGPCCHDVTREWRQREPDIAATSMDGVAASINVCTDYVMGRKARAKCGDPVARLAEQEIQRDRENAERIKAVGAMVDPASAEKIDYPSAEKMIDYLSRLNAGKFDVDLLERQIQHLLPKQVNTPIPMHTHSSVLVHESSGKMPKQSGCWNCHTNCMDRSRAVGRVGSAVPGCGAWSALEKRESGAEIKDHSGHGNDLTVLPGTPEPNKLPGPASEKSPPPPTKNPGRCSRCHAVVHAAAPSRDGNWYCERCVMSATALYEVQKYLEARKAREDAERDNPPPPPPKPGGHRPILLSGDLYGPKV